MTIASAPTRSRWARWPSPTSRTSRRRRATCPRRWTPSHPPRTGCDGTDTGADLPRLHADHALALADANLLDDAEHLIDRAVELSAAGGNDLELAELLLVSAEIDLAKGKPDEAHVSAVNAVAASPAKAATAGCTSPSVAPPGRGPADPGVPEIAAGLVMNGRALAAGGWRSDALGSMLLAALLHAEHGRVDDARALLAEAGPAAARSRRRSTRARSGRRAPRRAQR